MLNFDESRFLRIQSSAASLAGDIDKAITALFEKVEPENLFFLGTGGVAYLMMPAYELLRRKSRFPVFLDYPAELVLTGSGNLTAKSLVVMPSLSGTTKESVEMLTALKKVGATVITLVGHVDTPLGQGGDHVFVNFAEDDTSCQSFYIQSLYIALSIMRSRSEIANYDALVEELQALPELLLNVKKSFEPQAAQLAGKIAASDFHIFTGAGNVWPSALYYGTCILEEMQWIRTRPIHAADFFHGTLELVDKNVSVMLFKGEDAYRPLADRVERFCLQYTDRLTVLDTRSYALPGLSDESRALVSPMVLASLLERASAHLELMRDHPLATRRYYKRVSY